MVLVRSVLLTNVRAHSQLRVEFGPGLNILVGANGAGKTTVLEAISLVLQGSTLRPGSIRDLIKSGEDFLRIDLQLQSPLGSRVTAAAACALAGDRRLTADGAELDDASRWRELVPVRTFVPDDLRLIKGSPRRRRDFLDTLTGRADPAYRATLKQYEEALAQRNALLRERRPTSDDGAFGPWENLLARTGAAVSAGRASRLQGFVGPFQQMYRDLMGEPADSMKLVYRSNVAELEVEQYELRLAEMREADRRRTFTHLGPHRDDLRLLRWGLDVRECASQGEQRAALLSLVLAEWQESGEETGAGCEEGPGTGACPLLLLDDVMSELDEERRRALLRVVRRGGQAVITSTDLRYFTDDELAEAAVVELGVPG